MPHNRRKRRRPSTRDGAFSYLRCQKSPRIAPQNTPKHGSTPSAKLDSTALDVRDVSRIDAAHTSELRNRKLPADSRSSERVLPHGKNTITHSIQRRYWRPNLASRTLRTMVPILIPLVGLVAYGIWRSFRPAPGTTVALDPNMPDATNRAVTVASVREKDPRALRAFAGSMLHDFPIAASHLLARARILELQASPTAGGFNLFRALGTAIHDAGPIGALTVAIPGVGQSFVPLAMAASAAAAGHTKAVKNAPIIKNVRQEADRLGQNKFIHGAAGLYGQLYNQAHPAYWAAGVVRGLADKTLHGERLDRAIKDQGAKVASYFTQKAQIAAQVEGVPPGVVPALQAGAAVASGHPVSPQAVAAAAQLIPGGGAAVDALQQGANQAAQVVEANGGSQALQAMAQARDAIHPAVRHAFDIGASLPIAQHLQQTGFTEAEPLLAGGLATKVAHGLGMRDAPAEGAQASYR